MKRFHLQIFIPLFFFLSFLGSTFICNTHIIPVKNQEGVAMMFIMNFENVADEENVRSPEKCNQIVSAKVANRKCVYLLWEISRECWTQ